jgi:hypothetical protein
MSAPNNYPSSSWYHYDDQTCDYECMAIEYMYWAIVSYMGILDDPQTAQGINNEWEPYNATLLQTMDVLMYALITDLQYKLPLLAPDGNYCPSATSVAEINGTKKLVQITNVLARKTKQNNQPLFYIYDNGTVEKRIVIE